MAQGSDIHRRVCLFSGQVQGVGFRYTACNLAMRYAVLGFVRNTGDGRVELVIEGTDAEMDQLVAAVKQRMADYITRADVNEEPATGEFSQFTIRH